MTQPSYLPGSPQLTDEQFLRWGQEALNNATGASHSDPALDYSANAYDGYNGNILPNPLSPTAQQQQHGYSTQLARRPANQQQLVARAARQFADGDDGWSDHADGAYDGQVENGYSNGDDDIEALERRAAIAKREAQAKRKQIPPFIQKLSSFLDESRNTELIRWSDDGNSFIVLDEDEFAKTLIPELFKHSNYASFVRQLNMYGFHKKVGLSDNSMRASERRNKSPSEYINQFFRRGHPNLLWLIQKPKNPHPSSKGNKEPKGGDDGAGSARDGSVGPNDGHTADGSGEAVKQVLATGQNLAEVRQQLEAIQQQQRVISTAINRLRKDHNQIYEQAAAFQTLHDRHEASIKAILSFLATVYHRSLEGHGGQTLANLVANVLPQESPGQRGVIDVAHVEENTLNQGQRPMKRQPLLLGAPPSTAGPDGRNSREATVTPGASATTPGSVASPMTGGGNSDGMDALFDTTRSPPQSHAQIGDADLLSMINTVNSNNQGSEGRVAPRLDFVTALRQYQNGNGNSQLLASQNNGLSQHMMTQEGGNENALITSNTARMHDLKQRISSNREELDLLQRLQAEQHSKVQQLTNLVQPLSPTGSIPGLIDGVDEADVGAIGSPYQNVNSTAFDLDQMFSSGDYFSNSNNGGNHDQNVDGLADFDTNNNTNKINPAGGFDFSGLDGTVDGNDDGDALFTDHHQPQQGDHFQGLRTEPPTGGGRIVTTCNSSEGASPAPTTNTVLTASVADEESEEQMMGMGMGGGGVGASPSKRRRRM
ncbi:MAG: stress-responsive transcription factor hsf1 [Peltula sp. TS41687]|nr:MAG: stress-responsive transcription factor hsf1 [Peltula sp. TS41687]